MDSTVLAAIIGGLATIGASIVAVIVTRLLDNPMGFTKNARQVSLAGHWEGTVHQTTGVPLEGPITFQLKPAGRIIRGEGNVLLSVLSQPSNRTIAEPLTFFGGFVHDRFLKLEYEMQTQPGSVQFGFTLLELSPDGKTLSGPFVGYGALVTHGMVSGTLELHRRGAIPHVTASSQVTV